MGASRDRSVVFASRSECPYQQTMSALHAASLDKLPLDGRSCWRDNQPRICARTQRRSSMQQQRVVCGQQQSGQVPPPAPPQAVDRRGMLGLLAASSVALPASNAAAAPVTQAAKPAMPLEPLPVPPLTETFMSPEGYRFDYPAGWVVAFDRTGSTGNGAVVVVGDFRQLITVSVFRTETVPEAAKQVGLNAETGFGISVAPQQQDRGTVRFQLLRSGMASAPVVSAAPAGGAEPGAAAAAAPAAVAPAFDFEYSIESCVGEIEEGRGGVLRCLGPFGNIIPTKRQRHIGRTVLINGVAYSLNGSATEDRWPVVGSILQAVVDTFRS